MNGKCESVESANLSMKLDSAVLFVGLVLRVKGAGGAIGLERKVAPAIRIAVISLFGSVLSNFGENRWKRWIS